MWTRRGFFPHVPDVIVSPGSTEEAAEVLRWAVAADCSVIPYGAGSGVCAGALPIRGGLILSLKRMDRIRNLDSESMVAEIEAGIYGETLERRLNPMGFTMGHFPSSIYCSTLGGYLAARSAGQMSSRYGKIEDMVVGLEFVTPDGVIHRTRPMSKGGGRLDWNQIILGSEGTLAVITAGWMKLHRKPEHRCFQSYHFNGLRQGLDAMRRVMQAGVRPSVLRLYDELDTIIASTHGGMTEEESRDDIEEPTFLQKQVKETFESLKSKSLAHILKRPSVINRLSDKLPGKCLLVVLTEGRKDLALHDMGRVRAICERVDGRDSGEGPARYWLEHRYSVSYKQSKIFNSGGWVDTMEVATTWRDMESLYYGVKKAVAPHAFIMAHFSHAYRDGCCIYFSFASSSDSDEEMEDTYGRVWQEALKAVHDHGGTITHHHGVGLSKGAMLPVEFGDLWPVFQDIKLRIDPKNRMNPGKLGLK